MQVWQLPNWMSNLAPLALSLAHWWKEFCHSWCHILALAWDLADGWTCSSRHAYFLKYINTTATEFISVCTMYVLNSLDIKEKTTFYAISKRKFKQNWIRQTNQIPSFPLFPIQQKAPNRIFWIWNSIELNTKSHDSNYGGAITGSVSGAVEVVKVGGGMVVVVVVMFWGSEGGGAAVMAATPVEGS